MLNVRTPGGSHRNVCGDAAISTYIQTRAHFLTRLKIGHLLTWDADRFACTGIAPGAGFAFTGGEGAKAAQFDTAALRKLLADLVEKNVDDSLNHFGAKAGVFIGNSID